MAIDIENLPEDLKQKEKDDARAEGIAKFGIGFVSLLTAPWLGVVIAGAGALTYAASFFVADEQKRLEYKSDGIKAMAVGTALAIPGFGIFVGAVLMVEGGVDALFGKRDGPWAPIANISRFIARKLTRYPDEYLQTEVEMLAMQRQYQQQQNGEKMQQSNPEKQQSQTIDHAAEEQLETEKRKKEETRSSQPALQNSTSAESKEQMQQQSTQQNPEPTEKKEQAQQQQPASGVKLNRLTKAATYTAAQTEYGKSIKESEAKPFKLAKEPVIKDGVTTIVFDDPNHEGNSEYQVTYQIKDGKPFKITPGGKATCMLPPIQKETSNGFEVISIQAGEQTLLYEKGEGKRTNIVRANPAAGKLKGVKDVDPFASKTPPANKTIIRSNSAIEL